MKKIAALFVVYSCCLLVTGIVQAQNLVPNPSFEEYSSCPDESTTVEYSNGWFTISNTPDYFNRCATSVDYIIPNNSWGNQEDFNGNGYCGFWAYYNPWSLNGREFLGCELDSTLEVGNIYYTSFSVSLSDNSNCGVNNIGILLSTVPFDNPLSVPNTANFKTQQIITEQESWVRVSGEIIADSAYRYLVIGNLYSDANTDTIIIAPPDALGYGAYYYIDNICISSDSTACEYINLVTNKLEEPEVKVYPNPTTDRINLSFKGSFPSEINIYNLFGKLVYSKNNYYRETLNVSHLHAGIYSVQIIGKNFSTNIKLIISK